MNIGLDWDDTFTRDPESWRLFIFLMQAAGHKVYIVTLRDEQECVSVKATLDYLAITVDGICPTNRTNKEKFMFKQGICIDVWIDDNPRSIVQDMEPLTYN